MEQVFVNTDNGHYVRPLTVKEKRKLDKYNLSYSVKMFIFDIWSRETKPIIPEINVKLFTMGIVVSIFNILLPLILWLEFVDHNGVFLYKYMGEYSVIFIQSIHRIGLFILSAIMIISLVLSLILFYLKTTIDRIGEKIWRPPFLDGFEKKNKIRNNFFFVIFLLTISGLIVNSFYLLAILYPISLLVLRESKNILTEAVKDQIKKQTGYNL